MSRHKSAIILSTLIALGAAAFASAADNPTTVTSFTGELQVRVGDTVKSYPAGVDPKTIDIPAGAEISVVGGKAEFSVAGKTISAGDGATFKVASSGDKTQIAAKDGSTPLTVTTKNGTVQIPGGSDARITTLGHGAELVASDKGSVTVTRTDNQSVTLETGKSASMGGDDHNVVFEVHTAPPKVLSTPLTFLPDLKNQDDKHIVTIVSPSAPH